MSHSHSPSNHDIKSREDYYSMPIRDRPQIDVKSLPKTDKTAAPPREELKDKNIKQIAREYDVSEKVAVNWLSNYGMYEPHRNQAGTKSELGKKLLETDPDEI